MARARASFCLATSFSNTISRCCCACTCTWARRTSIPGTMPAFFMLTARWCSSSAVRNWARTASIRPAADDRAQIQVRAHDHDGVPHVGVRGLGRGRGLRSRARSRDGAQVEHRLGDRQPGIKDIEGPDKRVRAGRQRKAKGLEVDPLSRLRDPARDGRQQPAERRQPRAARRGDLLPAEDRRQVVREPSRHGLRERQPHGLCRRETGGYAAHERAPAGGARRPGLQGLRGQPLRPLARALRRRRLD